MTTERILAFRDLVYSGSPQVAAREEGRESTSPSTLPSLNCLKCKRTLIPGAMYADGFTDTALFCHACSADDFWASYYAAEESMAAPESYSETPEHNQ